MFTLEMRYDYVAQAPHLSITDESATQYVNAAAISISLASFIRSLGYSARAHIAGSNYQIMMPPVAFDAGLGELGRMGYLISPTLGPRVRLGGVTTDMPLIPDRPIAFGVQEFCQKCLKCAENCPSGAITSGKKIDVRGVEKWQLDIERCLRYWRIIGTDCGLCMKVCPYSHPPAFIHNLVRAGIKKSPLARYISIYADDLFYGRKTKYNKFNRQV
jgi:reductive dehalogenase